MAYPQEQQPVIGSVFSAQPSWEVQKESPYRTTQARTGGGESTTPGTEFAGGLAAIEAAKTKQLGATDALGNVRADLAATEATGAQNQLATAQAADAEREARHKELAPEIARRMAQSKEDVEEYRKMPAAALFADRKGASSVALAIGMAVGAISDAMAARANALLGRANGPSTVSAIINQDIERQREKLAKASAQMQQSGKSVQEIQAYEDRLNARLDAKKVRMLETAQLSLQAALKGKGMALADAMKTKEAADIEMETAKARTALVQNIVDKTEKAQSTTTSVGEQTKTINREPTTKEQPSHPPNVQQQVQYNRLKTAGNELHDLLDNGKGAGLTPDERNAVYDIMSQDAVVEKHPDGAYVLQAIAPDRLASLTPNARRALGLITESIDAMNGITTGAVSTKAQILDKTRRWLPGQQATKEDVDAAKRFIRQDVDNVYAPASERPRASVAPPRPAPLAAETPGEKKPAAKKAAAASVYSEADRAQAEAVLHDPKSDKDDRDAAIKILKGERF